MMNGEVVLALAYGLVLMINGEVVLALAYGLVLMISGLWIWRRVVKDYLRH